MLHWHECQEHVADVCWWHRAGRWSRNREDLVQKEFHHTLDWNSRRWNSFTAQNTDWCAQITCCKVGAHHWERTRSSWADGGAAVSRQPGAVVRLSSAMSGVISPGELRVDNLDVMIKRTDPMTQCCLKSGDITLVSFPWAPFLVFLSPFP